MKAYSRHTNMKLNKLLTSALGGDNWTASSYGQLQFQRKSTLRRKS